LNELFYSIDAGIFNKFPGYVRGIVLAYDLTNSPSPADLIALLRAEEESLRQRLTIDNLNEHPRIKVWREAFRALGIKPSEFRSSIEAMTRRVLRNDPLPTINALVDIGNLISLRYLIPAGSHAIDHLTSDIALRPANGNEDFTAFGSDVLEHPDPGEIIFVEGNIVLTRRWVWRQSNHTLTLPETRSVEFNIDAMPLISPEEVQRIAQDIIELTQRFCGGRARTEIISAENPRISLKG